MNRPLFLLFLSCLLLAQDGPLRHEALDANSALSIAAISVEADDDETVLVERPDFGRHVVPLVTKYCLACHNSAKARGGVMLDGWHDEAAAKGNVHLWENAAVQLRSESMPPPGRPRPTAAEVAAFNAWLDAVLPLRNSRRVSLRRLNRSEYNNTVRDLIGLDLRPADRFPADDLGHGFDNNGDVLSLSPLLLEKYLDAADTIGQVAFRSDAVRQRILHPPPDDPLLLPLRAVTYPVRAPVEKRLILSAADLAPADPAEQERQRAYEILRAFADRAYRRPVTHDELTRLLLFVESAQKSGEGVEKGIRTALRAILVSPHFLFRVETAADRLEDFVLANRLSYFLWSSMPDEELFRHAARKTLRQRKVLSAQVRRMLRDPKSRALAANFAAQWLQTRALRDIAPDPDRFPPFDEALRSAMFQESECFFDSIVRGDRSILDFLDADYTFVNERLARHYGIAGVHGEEFRRISLAGTPRAGVLTQASVLTVTSNPTRTSPVKRGKWILDNILGAPPPPPPPGAGDLRDDHSASLSGSLRQRLEQHRANPDCASCHRRMDPLGFGLENFDAIGTWREREGALAIDASGTLPGGVSFNGPAELRAILKGRPDAFARCFTEKLFIYALGRGLDRRDRLAVDAIVRKIAHREYRFSSLILAIVFSEPFQGRGDQP
ncbi:MAG TPA: DUF1592 domain-containing protein [Gemmataceae bacterium]|nr:DUF1592 domain-containing protein [Gemmataceae bacterium]